MGEATRRVPAASIVVPAHDEGAVIERLLHALLADAGDGEFELVVVCNGCTDDTAARARATAPAAQVIEIPEPSKAAALRRGDHAVRAFPRIYLDADVELATADVRALVAALHRPGIHAAGPVRRVPRSGSSRPVGWYYDVWEQLPQVRTGLFGRGVIAVSETGFRRVAALPQVISDDVAVSEAFAPHERVVVDAAEVVVHPARTLRALVDRRVRMHAGLRELDRMDARGADARTSPADLAAIVRRRPALALRVPVFLAVAVLGRLRARRAERHGEAVRWQRDDSRP